MTRQNGYDSVFHQKLKKLRKQIVKAAKANKLEYKDKLKTEAKAIIKALKRKDDGNS